MKKYKHVDKVIPEYTGRFQKCEEVHRKKIEEINRAYKRYQQIIPDLSIVQSQNQKYDNDSKNEKRASKSQYATPLYPAIIDKLKQDVITYNQRFEISSNDDNVKINDAFEKALVKVWTYKNNNSALKYAMHYLLNAGVLISKTGTNIDVKKFLNFDEEIQDFKEESVNYGRVIDIEFYDPAQTLLDYNADPMDVGGTSEYIIFNLAYYDSEYVKSKYGLEMNIGQNGSRNMDVWSRDIETDSGEDKSERIPLRAYYKDDGNFYIILGDEYIIESGINDLGIIGRIPFNIVPFEVDPYSQYGISIFRKLEPTLDIIDTAFNMVADNVANNNNAPFLSYKGVIEDLLFSVTDYGGNEIIEINADKFFLSNSNVQPVPVDYFVKRLEFPEVTNGAVFLIQNAIDMVYKITGLSPMSMSGVQDTQIRTDSIAQMLNNSSLRSTSKIVNALEDGFVNPTTWDILRIFSMHYKDFPTFAEEGIEKSFISNIKNIRVKNGSFLMSDKLTTSEQMDYLRAKAYQSPVIYNLKQVEEDDNKAKGIPSKRYFNTKEEIQDLMNGRALSDQMSGGGQQ